MTPPFSRAAATQFLDAVLSRLFPPLALEGKQYSKQTFQKSAQQVGIKPDVLTKQLPALKKVLATDLEAILQADPAAQSLEEIILTYPGFYAIATYRVAHILWKTNHRLLARACTEGAHSKTGIDIHPGATIGESFCIDHGTGVVIGETCIIGNHVTLYQGVTLGGLVVHRRLKEKKRHPTIGDYVTIYANATILGGKTTIGDHATIGGSVWLTESVPPKAQVFFDSSPVIKRKLNARSINSRNNR